MRRKTDSYDDSVHFQVGRLAVQNGEWYYMTRERGERGPFTTRQDAESDLASYIYHRHNIEKFTH